MFSHVFQVIQNINPKEKTSKKALNDIKLSLQSHTWFYQQDRSRVTLQRAASCGTCGQPWPTGTQDPSGRSEGSSDSASMAQLTEGMFQIQPKVETTTQNARKMHQFETQVMLH